MTYYLCADPYKDWAAHQHTSFVPTPRQQPVIDAVRAALDSGLYYTKDVLAFCADRLGVSPEDRAKGATRVEGGDLGMDCYYARCYLDAVKQRALESAAHESLRPVEGMKLGVLRFNDFKRTSACVVTAVEGNSISFTGKRGAVTIAGKAKALQVAYAMDRAASAKQRPTTFAQFVAEAKAKHPPVAQAQEAA